MSGILSLNGNRVAMVRVLVKTYRISSCGNAGVSIFCSRFLVWWLNGPKNGSFIYIISLFTVVVFCLGSKRFLRKVLILLGWPDIKATQELSRLPG